MHRWLLPLDLTKEGQLEAVFETISKKWGRLDLCLHSIASAPKEDLQGRVVDCSKKGFLQAMELSCWSFMRMAKLAEPLMKDRRRAVHDDLLRPPDGRREHTIWRGPVKAALEFGDTLHAPPSSVPRESGCTPSRRGRSSPVAQASPSSTRPAQGGGEGTEPQLVPVDDIGVAVAFLGTQCGEAHHRRDALHRRRLPHHPLSRRQDAAQAGFCHSLLP